MARSGRSSRKQVEGGSLRWIVGGSALLMAALALYVLMNAGANDREPAAMSKPRAADREASRSQEALDDIDAGSREAMRDLLREAGE